MREPALRDPCGLGRDVQAMSVSFLAIKRYSYAPTGNGKCDPDKKPRYCSKECQRADWKDHKAFCKPGMPCSVIDTNMGGGPAVVRGGDFSISITGSNGQVTYISSSTMSPEELREFRDAATLENHFADLADIGVAPIIEKYYL